MSWPPSGVNPITWRGRHAVFEPGDCLARRNLLEMDDARIHFERHEPILLSKRDMARIERHISADAEKQLATRDIMENKLVPLAHYKDALSGVKKEVVRKRGHSRTMAPVRAFHRRTMPECQPLVDIH